MVDTVRSVSELLDILFALGQAPRSITEQDMRDAIVSISLETGNFSDLPRSGANLSIGRLWIDDNLALRVVLVSSVSATLGGAGSLFAFGLKGGVQLWPGDGTTRGVTGLVATPALSLLAARATIGGAGSLIANPVQVYSGLGRLSGAGALAADPTGIPGGAFTGEFSPEFDLYRGGFTAASANATIAASSGVVATPQRGTFTAWDPTRTSIYITLSNSNNIATKTGFDGWYAGVTSAQFKSSGKWYWEFQIVQKVGDTGVGLANPSWPVDNGDPAFGSYLGLPGATTSIGLYGDVSNGYYNDGSATFGPMPNVVAGANIGFALDCDNWKWWARQDGGAWNVGQAGAQDPATNQGGIAIASAYRTGGIGPAVTLQGLNDVVIERFTQASWAFIAPTGYIAP